MLGKIAGAFNSHDNQDSKIKQPEHEVIRLVVVELNSLYLLDSHHSNVRLLGFTLLPPRSEVLHQWQRLVTIFFLIFLFGRVLWASSWQRPGIYQTSYNAQDSSPTRTNYLAQNVNNGKIEKSWPTESISKAPIWFCHLYTWVLLCARHCSRHAGYGDKQIIPCPLSVSLHSKVGDRP